MYTSYFIGLDMPYDDVQQLPIKVKANFYFLLLEYLHLMASTTCLGTYIILNHISLFTVVACIIFSLTSRQRVLQCKSCVSAVMRLNARCQSDERKFERTTGRRLKARVLPRTVSYCTPTDVPISSCVSDICCEFHETTCDFILVDLHVLKQ